ncbi:MAG TPA: hypothetical protein VH643_34620 [Gemmataceae bacterium]|jgi:hypothetical protein
MYRITKRAIAENIKLIVFGCVAFISLWGVLLSHRPVPFSSGGVVTWWTLLSVVGVINLCIWQRSARAITERKGGTASSFYTFQRWQLLLSAVFVLGCGFRSLFPRADVQRLSLSDSWLSSVFVGRSIATAAELCFMAQWAILLYGVARDAGCRFAVVLAWLIVPFIAVAEVCSWHATLTTCYLGNVLEESIWTLSASLLVLGCLRVAPRCVAARRPFLLAALVLGFVYVLFMTTVDVPMYVARWQADEAVGRAYLNLGAGLQDAWSRRVVSFAWEEWRAEIPWMTLYFSVCVWWSLALVHAPRWWPVPRPGTTEGDARQALSPS